MGFVPLPYRALAADQQGVEGLEGLVADCSAGEDVRLPREGLGGLLGHAFFIFHLQCGYSLKRLGKALCGGVWQPFCRVWQPAQLSGMIR